MEEEDNPIISIVAYAFLFSVMFGLIAAIFNWKNIGIICGIVYSIVIIVVIVAAINIRK